MADMNIQQSNTESNNLTKAEEKLENKINTFFNYFKNTSFGKKVTESTEKMNSKETRELFIFSRALCNTAMILIVLSMKDEFFLNSLGKLSIILITLDVSLIIFTFFKIFKLLIYLNLVLSMLKVIMAFILMFFKVKKILSINAFLEFEFLLGVLVLDALHFMVLCDELKKQDEEESSKQQNEKIETVTVQI